MTDYSLRDHFEPQSEERGDLSELESLVAENDRRRRAREKSNRMWAIFWLAVIAIAFVGLVYRVFDEQRNMTEDQRQTIERIIN